jgi:hypothetical protein
LWTDNGTTATRRRRRVHRSSLEGGQHRVCQRTTFGDVWPRSVAVPALGPFARIVRAGRAAPGVRQVAPPESANLCGCGTFTSGVDCRPGVRCSSIARRWRGYGLLRARPRGDHECFVAIPARYQKRWGGGR